VTGVSVKQHFPHCSPDNVIIIHT